MPQYVVAGEDFWVEVSDNKKGDISISVASNTDAVREAYVCIFPGKVSTGLTDLQSYIESDDYANNRWTVSQKGKAPVVVESAIKLYWEEEYKLSPQELQLAKDVPEFNSYVSSNSYPANKTFAYTFSAQDIEKGGRLLIVPVGFSWDYKNPEPENLKGDPFPKNGDGKYPIMGDWSLGSGGFYYDVTETTSGSIASISINNKEVVLILKKE